jgi:hypothetical protein
MTKHNNQQQNKTKQEKNMESCIIGKNNETMAWESKFGLL